MLTVLFLDIHVPDSGRPVVTGGDDLLPEHDHVKEGLAVFSPLPHRDPRPAVNRPDDALLTTFTFTFMKTGNQIETETDFNLIYI